MNTHPSGESLLPLEEPASDGRTVLNSAVWFVDSDGYRVVFHRHEPIYRIALTDEVHLRLVAVALRQSRLARQEEICQGFGHGVSTQARWERQYGKHGIDGLVSKKHTGRNRQLDKSQEGFVRRWFHAGHSNRRMAKRLGVDEGTIRQTLKRLGLAREPAVSPVLPGIEDKAGDAVTTEAGVSIAMPTGRQAVPESGGDVCAETTSPAAVWSTPSSQPCGQDAPVSVEPLATPSLTLDHDPRDRRGDRFLARAGLLDDAVPLFADAQCVPRAGALLAVPLLVRHGLIEAFVKVYSCLHPSFYGLRTIVVTLFLAAMLRIKRPEHFKEYGPENLGMILGLDRAPEVKTVRRKLSCLAAMGRGKPLMEQIACRRIAEDEDRVAFLYIDGHVREYHGKFPLFEAKKAQRQVATPAATDTWVHTADGEPLLVVISEMNAKLTQVLEPILADVRRLVGDLRRMTVIFDRGGFSPKLFARLIAAGFDVITYRKGKVNKLASTRFAVQREQIDGVWREYTICDRPGSASEGYLWRRSTNASRPGPRRQPSGISVCGRCVCCVRADARRRSSPTAENCLP